MHGRMSHPLMVSLPVLYCLISDDLLYWFQMAVMISIQKHRILWVFVQLIPFSGVLQIKGPWTPKLTYTFYPFS